MLKLLTSSPRSKRCTMERSATGGTSSPAAKNRTPRPEHEDVGFKT